MNEKPAPEAAAPAAAPAPEKAPAKAAAPAPAEAPAAPKAAPAKKKKTGLIVGIIVAILALCGAGVAAFFLFFNKPAAPEDAIANTIDVIVSGKNTAVVSGELPNTYGEGSIPATFKIAKDAYAANVSLNLTEMSGGSMNGTVAVEVIYKGDTIYIKADGLVNALGEYGSLVKGIDGEWFGISMKDLMTLSSSYTNDAYAQYTKCATSTSIPNLLAAIADIYKNNKFIEANKYEGNEVTKKSSDLYTLSTNKEKLSAFIAAFENSDAMSTVKSCTNSTNTKVSVEDYDLSNIFVEFSDNKISRIVMKQPVAYTEVKYNTLTNNLDETPISKTTTTDLSITYQDGNAITVPSDYKSAYELIQLISSLSGGSRLNGGFDDILNGLNDYDLDDIDDDDWDLDDYDFDFDDYDFDDYDFDFDYDDYDFDLDFENLSSEDINTIMDLYSKYGGDADITKWDAADIQKVLDIMKKK